MHAVEVEDVVDVHLEHAGVGVRRAQHRGVQGVRADRDVVDVPALAAQEPLVLDPLHRRAEQLGGHERSPDLMSAARSTDFTMFW